MQYVLSNEVTTNYELIISSNGMYSKYCRIQKLKSYIRVCLCYLYTPVALNVTTVCDNLY